MKLIKKQLEEITLSINQVCSYFVNFNATIDQTKIGFYLEKMKKIQENLLIFLDKGDNIEENFINLCNLINDYKINNDKHDFRLILKLIVKITNNHHREPSFFNKIERILTKYNNDIQQFFSNHELFDIFKGNKRILLFLFKENFITLDNYIYKEITKHSSKFDYNKYPEYFAPEIDQFMKKSTLLNKDLYFDIKKEIPEDFEGKREFGENDNLICQLIKNDSIEEFIIYIEKNDYSINSTIPKSIYETNSYLNKIQRKSNISLIEYAAFFGSIQIFRYLFLNDAELTPSLWIYAMHSDHTEIIHFLEDKNVKLEDKKIHALLNETVKCHHNYITKYFLDNFMKDGNQIMKNIFEWSLKYYNFDFMQKEDFKPIILCELCKYDYYSFVYTFLESKCIDINEKKIL